MVTVPFVVLSRRVVLGRLGDSVAFFEPLSQVDQAAALAAEGAPM